MKDPSLENPYDVPYGEEPEGDYEDYDEVVRADIGEDIRDILNWKEEREALAERIRPIDVDELPPAGDAASNAYAGNAPTVPYAPADGFPGQDGYPGPGYAEAYPPGDGFAAPGYAPEYPPVSGNAAPGYAEAYPPGDGYPGQDFEDGGFGQDLRPVPEGYIPVESFSREGSGFGGPGYTPMEPESFPPGGGNLPPGGGNTMEKPGKKRRKTLRPYLFVSYAFLLIFFLLIGNLVYFNIRERDAILASPYNHRQDDLAATVRRGSILASDGQELAYTSADELGNETRVYPYGPMFAHVVGYTANGRSGLESTENVSLLTSHMDILERTERELNGRKALGDHVLTTLSPKLQQTAWQALGERRGAVVVLNPKTGAVLAMVSRPDFDPNTIGESWNAIVSDPNNSCLLNRSTQGLYVPGSTYKILTALAYLREHGSFDGYHYTCAGEITEGENTIHCAGGSVHGDLDFAGAFAVSCNCAFSDLGRKLGAKPLKNVMDSLLLGQTLPCPVLASKSRYDLSESDSTFRLMQTAFGQGGTAVTPWQMALIVSAIANKGTLMEPYLVEKVLSPDGKTVSSHSSRSYRRLLAEEEANALSGLLRAVVTNGSAMELAGFPVACYGKTGSGEFTRSDGSRGTHAWFVGYAGVTDADVAFAVIAEDSGSGSDVAVPIAHAVLNAYYS